jgi:hypothetical protein
VIGLVAMPAVRAELAGAPTNRRTAKAAITPQQFDPWVHLVPDRIAPGQRRADSGGSRSPGDPSPHGRRSGKAAGHGSGRVFGTHRPAVREGPVLRDQTTVPAQQRRWRHEEGAPASPI